MDKTQKPKEDHEEESMKKNIQKRFENMFTGSGEPLTNMSIHEVENLKSRVAELEAQLAQQPLQSNRGSLPTLSEALTKVEPSRERPVHRKKPATTEAEPKQVALWIAGIFIAVSLGFLGYSLYNLFVTQGGLADLSDKALIPLTLVMVIMSVIGFRLMQRDQRNLGGWILYVINSILPPVLATLFLAQLSVLLTGYLVIFSLVFINFVIPRESRLRAIITAVAGTLVIFAIELWDPTFRLPSNHLSTVTPAFGALALLATFAFILRQAMAGNIRTKLIGMFVVVVILAMAVVAFFADRSLRNNLTVDIVQSQASLANSQGFQVGQAITSQFDKLKGLATVKTLQVGAETASLEETRPLDTIEIEQLNLDWRDTVAAENTADPLAIQLLYNPLSTQLRNFQKTFPENVEILLTDQKGFSIAATDLPSNYYQADALWWRTAHTTGHYIGQPIFNPATNSIALDIAVPVFSYRNGEFMGVLRATVDFDVLTDLLAEGFRGQTGYSLIYQPNDQQIKLETVGDGNYKIVQDFVSTDLQEFVTSPDKSTEVSLNGIPFLVSSAPVRSYSSMLQTEGTTALDDLDWQVIVLQEKSEALQSVSIQTRNNLMLTLLITIVVIILAYFLARFITNPIIQLNAVAMQIASGDLSAEAKIMSNDEVGTLAANFNTMTSQLRSLFGSLEQRVQDRTHDLELATEVGRMITEKVADASEMLTAAAEMIRSRFELYYTQVYLTDTAGQKLILRAGTGEVGEQLLSRGHQLMVDSSSLNGQAVLGKKPIIVADTLLSASFKPNPLLPKTRSEMAVPLIANGQVIGVLDMQSERPDALTETNLAAFQALAGQLAIAIQNANLFAETQEARSEVEEQMRRFTEQGWQDFLNAIDRGQKLGFAFEKNTVSRLQAEELVQPSTEDKINIPINVTGTKVGEIQLPLQSNRSWTPSEIELIQATSAQLAQHVENLRLLAQAEHFQKEAEQAVRRLTQEGWSEYLSSGHKAGTGYVYDLNQVQPLSENGHHSSEPSFKQALVVGNEAVGELELDLTEVSEETTEIISAVVEQLSGHIENLRLLEQTEQQRGQLSEALKASRLANWEYDFVNDIFTFNDQFYELLGTTAEREGGYTMPAARYAERFVYPEDIPVVGAEIQKAVETTDPNYSVQIDHRVILANGEIGYFNVRFQIQKDASGRTVRSYGANQDITERKRSEEAIKAEQQRTQTILQSVTIPMVITRLSDNHLTFVNAPALDVTQFSYDQVINQPSPNFYANLEDRKKFITELRAKGEVADMVVQLLRANGEVFWALMSAKIFDYQAEQSILTTFMDISDRIRAQEAVAKRATELATVAQVSTTASTVLDPSQLLKSVVELTKERFELYHAHIYLTDADQNALVLTAGSGEVGKQMLAEGWSIPVDHELSIIADAYRTRQSVVANDVYHDKDSTFLSNRLLPDTRSELALPLLAGDEVLGVFDVQSDKLDYFTAEDINIYTTLASQVSVALQNARLFDQTEEALTWQQAINQTSIMIGQARTIEDVVRAAAELLPLLGMLSCSVSVVTETDSAGMPSLCDIHIVRYTDHQFVNMPPVLGQPTAGWLPDEAKYYQESRVTVFPNLEDLSTIVPTTAYKAEAAVGYMLKVGMRSAIALALGVHKRAIGYLTFTSRTPLAHVPEKYIAWLSGVVDLIAAAIDNQLLFSETERGRQALSRRAAELATVANVSTTVSTVLDPDELLQSVVDLTKERFELYHAHIYLANESWDTLLLAAGAGEVGRKLVSDGHAIPMNLEQSLVARATRERKAVIVNDVNQEPGFLPNPLLPETRAEMAVPMMVGNKLLGVFDVQSTKEAGFSEEDANIYVTLATQVGVALQNARLYVEQAATVAQLRELDRLKSSFLANMSHELRTPLNSILGFTDVMMEGLDGPLTEYMDNDLRLIQKNGQHLLHLINDVLDMAKIEAGRMNLNPESFKAFEVMEEVTNITSTLASEKSLSLFIDEAADRDITIYADRTRLRQVMINLVNNSIKFTEKGEVALNVSPMDGGRVLISVRDTGLGIPPEKLEAIFQEFTQVDSSTTRKTGGTGLGLPISRRLVEMHGGRLWADSAGIPGEGSIFFVELPLEARITEVVERQEK